MRDLFHRLVTEVSLPMLARWKLDLLRSGPSMHDQDSYFLMRSFADMAEREQQEAAFYGSDEWRLGPRERILAMIESYNETVFEAADIVVDTLRTTGQA